jgi:hypothetical protein
MFAAIRRASPRLGIGPPPVMAVDPQHCRCRDDDTDPELMLSGQHHRIECILNDATGIKQATASIGDLRSMPAAQPLVSTST